MNTDSAMKILEENGFKVTRVGKRGRIPKLNNVALEDMTVQQRKTYLWRQRNREKVLAYHREYNKKRKAANNVSLV